MATLNANVEFILTTKPNEDIEEAILQEAYIKKISIGYLCYPLKN